jgi:ABC-type lipoprotein export system ATPase subunit/nicotinic acid mononucleotide adenylyltransferase
MSNFYIDKIIIRWYGPLQFNGEAKLKSGVNLIIGRNGSGKTRTLRMIENASKGQQFYNPNNQLDDINLIQSDQLVYISIKDGNIQQTVTFLKNGGWQNWNVLNQKVKFISSDRSVRGSLTTANPFKQFSDFSISEPNNEINIVDEFNKALISELLRKIKSLRQEIPDLIKEIEDHYQSGLVDFEKSIRIDFDRDPPAFLIDYRKKEVQLQDLSAGEKEYLYFLAFLYRVRDEKDKIILIDEPELHLHSSQIRKLCDLILTLSKSNQIIIATHSGEILQYFLKEANILLVGKGEIENIEVTEQIEEVARQLGLLVDPSFFTSHWICAENNPLSPITKQNDAPTTEVTLGWIFGKGIDKKFWGFGSKRGIAEARIQALQDVNFGQQEIKLSIIFDGDKLSTNDNYPPKVTIKNNNVYFFPFWELENIFLNPKILNEVIVTVNGKDGNTQFWEKINENKEQLFKSILRTIIKNTAFSITKYNLFSDGTIDEFNNWKKLVTDITINEDILKSRFEEIINSKNYKWIPGKEALKYAIDLSGDFWTKIKNLVDNGNFLTYIKEDQEIEQLINVVNNK